MRPIGPYRRLPLVMDAWRAWWFWLIAEAERLPSRAEWLRTRELLVIGKRGVELGQLPLAWTRDLDEEARQRALAFIEKCPWNRGRCANLDDSPEGHGGAVAAT